MSKFYALLFLSFLTLSCNKGLLLQLPDNYCGSVYIVADDYVAATKHVYVDSNGIGYVNNKLFNDDILPKVFSSDSEITKDTKFYASGILNWQGEMIKYATLYVPCGNEINKSSEYWMQKQDKRNNSDEFRKLIQNNFVKIRKH